MTAKKTAPTVDKILELYDDCKKRYSESGLYSVFDGDDTLYELDFRKKLLLPEEVKKEGVVLPTARDLVDTCCDHTDIYNARVWVNKKGTSPKSEEEMNLLRKFGLGVLYRNNVEASISPLRVSAKHYWIHGLTIIKTVWDADRYRDKPEQKKNESEDAYATKIDTWRAEKPDSIPIVIQAVHPKNIMLDPYHSGGSFVFETTTELGFDVTQKYPAWSNPKGAQAATKVEHISFWTKDWRCELYDRAPVLTKQVVKHKYGFIPYVVIDTGLGNLTADNDLTKRYVGILRYIEDMLYSESRDYSIGDIILKMQAWPWGYVEGDNAAAVTEVFKKFGEYTQMPAETKLVDMAPRVPPEALLTWLGAAANYLGSHAAPPSVRGMGETGVRAASDRRLLIAEASVRYTYSNEAFRHGVAKVLSNCARIMKYVVPGSIDVWARTPTDEFDIEINKDAMKPPFNFYVEFAPVSEEDEYRRHDDLIRLVESTILPVADARKQMSNLDLPAVEKRELKAEIKANPLVQQVLSVWMAGKLGVAIEKLTVAEVAEGKRPPPQITPPGMESPSQGGQGREVPGRMTGTMQGTPPPNAELQNKLANLRSQISAKPNQGQGGGGAPYK